MYPGWWEGTTQPVRVLDGKTLGIPPVGSINVHVDGNMDPDMATWDPPMLQGKLGLALPELTVLGQKAAGAGPGPIGISCRD